MKQANRKTDQASDTERCIKAREMALQVMVLFSGLKTFLIPGPKWWKEKGILKAISDLNTCTAVCECTHIHTIDTHTISWKVI